MTRDRFKDSEVTGGEPQPLFDDPGDRTRKEEELAIRNRIDVLERLQVARHDENFFDFSLARIQEPTARRQQRALLCNVKRAGCETDNSIR